MNIKKTGILALCALAFLGTAACTPTVQKRGNMLEDYQMKAVIPGIHTRSDVLRILGSPTTQAPFNDNVWYYMGQETEKKGILDPKIKEERVVMVEFNPDGTVQYLKEMNDKDRVDVPISEKQTPTHGNDVSFMQQMLGNLGRFNTAGEKAGK